MYRRLVSLLLLGIMITSVNAAPSTSVGVINSERVLLESKRGQAMIQSLNAQMHEKRAAISALQLEIEENVQRRDLSPDELSEGLARLERLHHPGLLKRIWMFLVRLVRALFGRDRRRRR